MGEVEADEARVLQQVSVQAVVKSSRMLEVDTCKVVGHAHEHEHEHDSPHAPPLPAMSDVCHSGHELRLSVCRCSFHRRRALMLGVDAE